MRRRPGSTDSAVNFSGSRCDASGFQPLSSPGFRLAFGANAPDAQAVARRSKMMLRGDLVLLVLDLLAVEFYQPAAFGADQMVVMLVIVKMLVARVRVAQSLFARQPAFGQKLERAVNGREAHRRVFDFDNVVEVFGAEMAFGLEKDFEYKLTLCRLFKSGAPEMLEEYLFFLYEFRHCLGRYCYHSLLDRF